MATPVTSLDPSPGVKQVFLTEPIKIRDTERIFVIPPKVHIGGEHSPKQIQWVNLTGGPVTIWLPNGDHCLEPVDPKTGAKLNFLTPFPVPTNYELRLDVRKKPRDGYYEYNVYCKVIEDYAQGESEPGLSCP
jgi:hypothetical protein